MTQKKTEKSSSGKKILSEAKNSRDAAKKVKLSKSWENKSAESPHQKKVGKTEDSNIQSKLMNLVAKNAREKSSEGVQDFIRHMSMFFDRCSFSKDQISTRVENCEKKIKFLPKENMDFKIAGTKIYLNESEEKNLSLRKEMAINNTAKNFPKKSNLPERISSSASGKKLGQKPIAAKKSPASTFIGPKAQKSNDRRSDRENEIKTHFSLRSEKELSNTLQEKNMAISLKDEGARQELLKTGINASQKVKELLTATRRTKPSEIPLRKSRLDITYDSVNRSLKDKSSNFDSESSFSLTQGSSVREESFGSQKSAGLVSSNPKVLLDNNKCSQVFDDFQSKENPKLRDSPLACSPQHLPNKNSLTVTKAKVLDLDMVKSSNFAVLASGEAFQKLESFHQQVVSIKGKVFGEKSASSASTKLKQIVSKRSLGSINHSKKNNLLISLINSKSKSMLKHGRSKEAKGDFTKKRTLESPKSLIKKISRVFIDRRLKNTAKSSLNKSKKNLNAAQSYSLQDKPPSGKGSPKPPVSQEKEESKKEVKRSKISKPLGKESKPSTAESARSNSSKYSVEYNASKSSSRSTFKMTTPSFSRSKINGSELIKPVGRLTPSTPERDLRGNKTDDIDRPMTSAGKKMRTHDPDSIEKSSNDADLRDETTGGNVIKNYLNTENQTHEDNGLALQDDNLQKKESEKIHLEVRIDLETSNLMNDFLSDLEKEEKNTVEDDYLFTSYEVLKNNGEELMDEEDFQNESPIDCDYLILDEETNLEWKRLPNSTTPESSKQELTDKPILLEPYKSFSPIKRMPKCQTPPTKMKTRPKKKKVNTDSVNHSLVSTLGRYNSVTSLSGENTNIKAEAIGKNGFARGMMDNNSNYIFDDVGSVNLKRRNSEPNSLRGFVWKQPEVPIFRGNKTSVSSMASSLRHMNADELEDFRVWEPAPLKMTSHWEMSLYRYRRPWSVLSCSVFKDNRMANTPGIILESLRNGGSLDMSRSIFCQRDRISSQVANSFDVEPSIAQKNMDIRNWLSALNFPTPPSTSSDPVVEGNLYSALPVGSSIKNQGTSKRRKVLRTLNYSEEALKKKFEDTRACMSDKTGDLMDLIQRKSGGFVVAERKGHQVTTNHSHYKAVTNWESLSNFTDFSEKETPDLGALKTRSDGPQMSPEQREEKIQNPIAKCTEGDKSDELKCVIEEETRAISKPKIEPREDFWISIIRFLNGQTNFNVWKYLFIFSLSLIVYNFLNGGVVATVSSFDS